MRLAVSDLETARFKVKCARADDVLAADLPAIQDFCEKERVAMLTLRCDVAAIETVHAAESAGFQLMDTLLYFVAELGEQLHAPELASNVAYRTATAGDTAAVGAIAAHTFASYVSHYHADPRLREEDANAAYQQWAETSCQHVTPTSTVILAEDQSGVLGFGVLKVIAPGEGDAVLFGVAPTAQRRGIFGSLVWRSIEWARASGLRRLIYSTQIRNTVANRTVTKIGFRYERASYTFHKWYV